MHRSRPRVSYPPQIHSATQCNMYHSRLIMAKKLAWKSCLCLTPPFAQLPLLLLPPFLSNGAGFRQYLLSALTAELTRSYSEREASDRSLRWPGSSKSILSPMCDFPLAWIELIACMVSFHISSLLSRTDLTRRPVGTEGGRSTALALTRRLKASSPKRPSPVACSRTFLGSSSRTGYSAVAL